VWSAFAAKKLLNPFTPSADNPYDNPNFNITWVDTVCAVVYPDPANRAEYRLENFETSEAATAAGGFVTHQHPCGFCSTAQDLSVYMRVSDLTNPVRKCGIKAFFSQNWAR
jgi:hypothetical protein